MMLMMIISSVAMGGFMLYQQFKGSDSESSSPPPVDNDKTLTDYCVNASAGAPAPSGTQNSVLTPVYANQQVAPQAASTSTVPTPPPSPMPETKDMKTLQGEFQVAYDNLMGAIQRGDQANLPQYQKAFDEATKAVNAKKASMAAQYR